jgi:hypothetical protein
VAIEIPLVVKIPEVEHGAQNNEQDGKLVRGTLTLEQQQGGKGIIANTHLFTPMLHIYSTMGDATS